jgi:hypothetical protein
LSNPPEPSESIDFTKPIYRCFLIVFHPKWRRLYIESPRKPEVQRRIMCW